LSVEIVGHSLQTAYHRRSNFQVAIPTSRAVERENFDRVNFRTLMTEWNYGGRRIVRQKVNEALLLYCVSCTRFWYKNIKLAALRARGATAENVLFVIAIDRPFVLIKFSLQQMLDVTREYFTT